MAQAHTTTGIDAVLAQCSAAHREALEQTSSAAVAASQDAVRKHERRGQAERARADAATEQLEKLRTAHGDLQVRFDAARRRNRSPPPAIAFSPDKALEPPSPVISPSRRPLKPHAPAASRMF